MILVGGSLFLHSRISFNFLLSLLIVVGRRRHRSLCVFFLVCSVLMFFVLCFSSLSSLIWLPHGKRKHNTTQQNEEMHATTELKRTNDGLSLELITPHAILLFSTLLSVFAFCTISVVFLFFRCLLFFRVLLLLPLFPSFFSDSFTHYSIPSTRVSSL